MHPKGCGEIVQKRCTYSGTASVVIFLRNACPHGDNMPHSEATALYQSKHAVGTPNNNHKGCPSKFQCFGSSNALVKFTARCFRQFMPCINDANSKDMRSSVAYVHQQIPSPNPMTPFEKKCLNDEVNYGVLSNDVTNKMTNTNHADSKTDFSGNLVKAYENIIDTCDEVQFGLHSFLTGPNRTNMMHEHWENFPDQHQTKDRDNIVKLMSTMKLTAITKCSSFQNYITLGRNQTSKESKKLLIPLVSLRDEIKTDGFGVAVIELSCLVGMLHEEKVSSACIK